MISKFVSWPKLVLADAPGAPGIRFRQLGYAIGALEHSAFRRIDRSPHGSPLCLGGTGFDEQIADSYGGVAPAHSVSLTRSLGLNSWCPTGTLFSGMACVECWVPDSNVHCGFAGFGEKTNSLIRENNSLFVGENSLFRFLGNSLLTC